VPPPHGLRRKRDYLKVYFARDKALKIKTMNK